ncbi:head GIN domain-containing protein [Parabacteroides sp. PF5-9]|uniref:head GIN domain-containing protein n=1 Tax=Parabacteroides sp. PF5-9 TaxID=1742404 RepID=UPI0024749BE8|nr:head GIN domain-containing protein [Parabacteroides sp. PF5-9]
MVRKGVFFFLLTLLLSGVQAQGLKYNESRTVGSFNQIDVCCGIQVFITEGSSNKIRVETNDEEMLKQIVTEAKNNRLKIGFESSFGKRPRNLKVNVYMEAKGLREIEASSGSDVQSQTRLIADEIALSSSSGSDIRIELEANKLSCRSSSGSDIKLSGKALFATVHASSGSDIHMRDMEVESVEASASSGSDISLYVTKELEAKASSGADIQYKGNPGTVNRKVSSGGSVRQQ